MMALRPFLSPDLSRRTHQRRSIGECSRNRDIMLRSHFWMWLRIITLKAERYSTQSRMKQQLTPSLIRLVDEVEELGRGPPAKILTSSSLHEFCGVRFFQPSRKKAFIDPQFVHQKKKQAQCKQQNITQKLTQPRSANAFLTV